MRKHHRSLFKKLKQTKKKKKEIERKREGKKEGIYLDGSGRAKSQLRSGGRTIKGSNLARRRCTLSQVRREKSMG